MLAVVVAAVLAFSPGVGAHGCSPSFTSDKHVDPERVPCNSTDPAHQTTEHPRIWLDPAEGPRGTEFDFKGRGFPKGTVTAFEGNNANVDEGEILGTDDVTTESGLLSIDNLRAGGEPGSGDYMVWMKDSEGAVASATFTITSAMSFEPATAVIGEELTINIADWDVTDNGNQQGVAFVRIGGEDVHFPRVVLSDSDNCVTGIYSAHAQTKQVSFEVTVSPTVLTGLQTVSVYHEGQLANNGFTLCDPATPIVPETATKVELQADAVPVIKRTIQVLAEAEESTSAPISQSVDVDGGRDRKLEFKATVPGGLDNIGDSIVIEFEPSFDLLDPNPPTNQITIYKGEPIASSPQTTPSRAVVNGKVLTLEGATNFTGDSLRAGDYITIVIEAGAGIETPETPWGPDTPRGYISPEDPKGDKGYEIKLFFKDRGSDSRVPVEDKNYVVVKNPLSSTVPGATVRVVLETHAEEIIRTTDEIVVDFSGPSADSGFTVPSSITKSRIQVRYLDGTSTKTFNPEEVQVQGERVIFSVPSGSGDNPIMFEGDYSITFSNLARIRNPFSAGIKTIKVSSFVPGDIEDIIEAVVRRTTEITPLEGARGSEFTLEGKGYAAGTVTVFEGDDDIIDPGETLTSVDTVRGAFSVDLIVRGDPGEAQYVVRTRDSEGVVVSTAFDIKSAMSFDPPTAQLGSSLTITISDWEEEREEVVAAQVAGVEVFIAEAIQYENCIDHPDSVARDDDGRVTLRVDLPPGIPTGEQTVAVFDHSQLDYFDNERQPIPESKAMACRDLEVGKNRGPHIGPLERVIITDDPIAITKATIEIQGQSLTLTPSSAARGQMVTITGSGFTRAGRGSDYIDSVWIGGQRVEDDHSVFEIGSNGTIAFAVTVPVGVSDGMNEVRLDDLRLDGEYFTLALATLEVPEAAIRLEPAQGQRDTEFRVIGSGFIANEPVLVEYYSEAVITNSTTQLSGRGMLADSQGGFELEMKVPIPAEVGKTHLVTATADVQDGGRTVVVEAEAEHLVTQAEITTTPESVSPGDYVTIRGMNLPPYSLVRPIKLAGIAVITERGSVHRQARFL